DIEGDAATDADLEAELARLLGPPQPNRQIAGEFAAIVCGERRNGATLGDAAGSHRLRLTTYLARKTDEPRGYVPRDFERDGFTNAVDANWDEILKAQEAGQDVFFYLNQMAEGPGAGYKGICTNDAFEGLMALSVDFDSGLPDSYHVEPDIVIKTS